jgi:Vacuolar protein 14 C-terminal Fig4p binding
MVQKLNIILITSPELADFRKRLKSLETRVGLQSVYTYTLFKYLIAARRPSAFYDAISIVVSQCRRGIFALSSRPSLRARIQSAVYLVRPKPQGGRWYR